MGGRDHLRWVAGLGLLSSVGAEEPTAGGEARGMTEPGRWQAEENLVGIVTRREQRRKIAVRGGRFSRRLLVPHS
jgi:hypothetical protein